MIDVPPMAAADVAGVQHRQRFDAWGAEQLRNRQRFAGAAALGRGLSVAAAGSVRTLGVLRIASLAAAFGACAGFPIGLA
jgi:hypothetical protein